LKNPIATLRSLGTAAVLCLLAAAAALALPAAAAAAAKTVAIVPFKINAEKDMGYLRDGVYDMLSSRLQKAGDVEVLNRQVVERALTQAVATEAAARDFGRKLAADFVLFGSITALGNSISIDSKMVDVAGAKPTVAFFDQSEDAGGIIGKINLMAADINAKMFSREPAARASAAPAASAAAPGTDSAAPADARMHPEKMFKQQTGGMGGADSPFVSEGGGREVSPQFWKSAAFKLLFNGIAVGDIDGDGKNETVILTPQSVLLFRFEQGRFYQFQELETNRQSYYIGVDVADVNGNGVAEIFVTSLAITQKAVNSFVLEFDGKQYRKTVQDFPWFLRVSDLARGPALLGQAHRAGSPYGGAVYEMLWRNGRYEPETLIPTSGSLNVLGLALGDLLGNGRETVAAFDSADYIRIFDEAGKQEWKSAERYGGNTLYYAGDIQSPGDIERPIFFPMRMTAQGPGPDGKPQLLLVKNHDVAGLRLEKFRQFTEAQFISMFWDGIGLAPAWKTRKLTGYIRDFAFADFNNDGKKEIIAAVILDEGRVITTTPKSTVIALEMK
jgi:TolB-like protein